MNLKSNPKLDEYVMPFEGEAHNGTIVMLPYRDDTWANSGLDAMPVFLEMVKAISKYEKVYLLVSSKVNKEAVKDFILPNVMICNIEYNDSWARDNTLIFMKKGNKIRAVDFRFNAWGGNVDGLYDDWSLDDQVGQNLASLFKVNTYKLDSFILEGGSIHTDGAGTFLVTEACLLSKGRNSSLTKEQIEEYLTKYLNARKIIWLPHGIVNDETNEHVDNVCCFAGVGKVLLAYTENKDDLQYQYILEDMKVLENSVDANGNKLEIIKLPLPKTMYLTHEEASAINSLPGAKPRPEGDRLAGSYINFYMSDKFILLPQFDCEEDDLAYNVLHDTFKDKDIIRIKSRKILLAGGNIHCTTMQVPKGEFDNEKC